jgi:hypothetical protein
MYATVGDDATGGDHISDCPLSIPDLHLLSPVIPNGNAENSTKYESTVFRGVVSDTSLISPFFGSVK